MMEPTVADRVSLSAFEYGRMNESERNTAVLAIDSEIRIERQDRVALMDFGHAHHTRIGERHGPVPVFPMQLAQQRDMLLYLKADAKRTILEQTK